MFCNGCDDCDGCDGIFFDERSCFVMVATIVTAFFDERSCFVMTVAVVTPVTVFLFMSNYMLL
jgi:hypothetical protein